jgi:carbon-monoxide dehydrogenase small subunit
VTTASDTQAAQPRDSAGAGAARPGTAGGSPAGTSRVSAGAVEVNGTDVSLGDVPANWTLADLLRYRTSLRGTHLACEHGVCGVCTVLLDGDPVRSCLVLSHAVRDRQVTTVEGLDLLDAGLAQRLRAAFVARNAFQCGFCTPGMLALVFSAARDLAGQGDSGAGNGQPQRPADVARRAREVIDANICRCTGYSAIVAAATDVLQEPGRGGIADRAG